MLDASAGDELVLQRGDYEKAMKATVLARAKRAQQVVTGTSASTFGASGVASSANPANESASTSSMNKKH